MQPTTASQSTASPALSAIVGQSLPLRRVLERTARVARARLPVLVTGESGTGKELLARALHELSGVAKGPFVAVNCGSLARELAESELFGHERGAFTGAGARKTGWFEEASGGTLVLDEIGELPLDLQPKLLRVLETGRLRRVGGHGEVPVQVRTVALTLRDLASDAARGRFRLDLYHRLAGCELHLPALRERPSDIPLLVEHFLAEAAYELGVRTIDESAMALLSSHGWPGNVRELRNCLRRAVALTDSIIDSASLEISAEPSDRCEVRLATHAADGPSGETNRSFCGLPADDGDTLAMVGKTFAEMQTAIFRWALRKSRGSPRPAARALGISRSTFCDRVRRLGLLGNITA